MTTLNNVTNKLLNEYSYKFNENYNDIVQLNSTIQNKEELIIKTNENMFYNERTIIILQYFLHFSIAFFILTILFSLKIINIKIFIGLASVIFICLFIACYIHLAKHFNYINIKSKTEAVKVEMINYAKKLRKEFIPPYECPIQCSIIDEEDDDNDNNNGYNNDGTTLKIDPSLNVWKYGDVPVGTEIDDVSNLSPGDNPRPFFGTSYPQTLYYQCEWLGNKAGKNMPKQMIRNMKKYSTIPCNYRPNNTEKARLFCQKDPNELTNDEEFNENCQIYSSNMISEE